MFTKLLLSAAELQRGDRLVSGENGSLGVPAWAGPPITEVDTTEVGHVTVKTVNGGQVRLRSGASTLVLRPDVSVITEPGTWAPVFTGEMPA